MLLKTTLEPRKWSLAIRLIYLLFLMLFTPFAIVGLHNQGKDYAIIFFVAIAVLFMPDLFIKLFLKPVAGMLNGNQLDLKYYHGKRMQIFIEEIRGYSTSKEETNHGKKSGISLYLRNGAHIDFTEINIINISPLREFLNNRGIVNYGEERLPAWYFSKRKYD